MIFGDNFEFDDTTELPYGLPMRSFKSFRLAAQEAAVSRLYGGIHFRAAVETGVDQGILVVDETVEYEHALLARKHCSLRPAVDRDAAGFVGRLLFREFR